MLLPQTLPTNAIIVPQSLITTELHCLTSTSIGPSEDFAINGSLAAYPSGNPLQLVEFTHTEGKQFPLPTPQVPLADFGLFLVTSFQKYLHRSV